MNLEASIQETIPKDMDTYTILALWAVLALTIYFVTTKSLRGFYKKSEKSIKEHESLIAESTDRI